MADDIAHIINNSATAHEGAVVINNNGLKIVTGTRHIDSDLQPLNDVAISGSLINRFGYFREAVIDANVVQIQGFEVDEADTFDANIVQVSGQYVDIGSFK